jgi:serine/threonine protein kinase/Tol biopolymer transport system component
MPLAAGTRLGPYEIVAAIGAGGMGEVYQASDTRLNRTVAIKVLPPDWAADAGMQERFTREAQAVAALSHPNICTLHDIGHERLQRTPESGVGDRAADAGRDTLIDFLVMEYLEGETLDKRLERGALPLDQALKFAMAIADALDKAHRGGIIHRDLKPSNVMLTRSGPKLLDFGLAKLDPVKRPPSSPSGRATPSPPQGRAGPAPTPVGAPGRVTTPGLIIGTLQCMAPEQIEGAEADARTDIFAFGAILYEMVTGTKAFEGKNRALLIAAIATLELEPLSKIRSGVPRALDHVAKRCLAKDPDDRWQSAHDLALKLRWIGEAGVAASELPVASTVDKRLIPLLAVGLVVLAATAIPALLYWRTPVPSEPLQFRVPVGGLSDADISISPDGELIALVARPNTQESSALFVRPAGATTFRRLGGTDDSSLPFWSPDSRTIAFVAGGRLKRVDASGGAPKDIAAAPDIVGGAWNRDGMILFGSAAGLYRVSAEGGTPELLTTIEKAETGHYWPSFLPDGRRYIYLAWSADVAARALMVGEIGSASRSRLVEGNSNAVYAATPGSAASGHLVFQRDGTLFARPFDAGSAAFTGDPVHLADQLGFTTTNGHGHFAVSQNGVLLYFQRPSAAGGGPSGRGQTVPNVVFGWSDRTGRQLGLAGEQATYGDIDLSPDGKFVAITRLDSGPGADIWVIDWERAGVSTKLTLDPSDDINPVWSPGGDRIAFTTFRNGSADVYVKNANGVGPETPILNSPANEFVEDWSDDGKYLAYKLGTESFEDLYVLPLNVADAKPMPVVTGPYRKDEPQFSSDGKWLAYTSNESGTFEVYVISFPALDHKVRVSGIGGGGQPRWRGDGKELYYRGADGAAMVVDLKLGTRIEPGVARRLFPPHFGSPSMRDPARHQWSVTADGQRFLVRYPNASAASFGGGSGGAGTVPFLAQQNTAQPTQVGGQAFVSSGLTVIRNWPAAAGKAVR